MWYYTTQKNDLIFKKTKKNNVDKDEEQLGLSTTAGENEN